MDYLTTANITLACIQLVGAILLHIKIRSKCCDKFFCSCSPSDHKDDD